MIRWWTTEVRLPRYLFWPMVLSVVLQGLRGAVAVVQFLAG